MRDHDPTDLWYLRHLIAALDRRLPRPASAGEARIASDSAALRGRALARIAEIEAASAVPAIGPRPASQKLA
jgi:hypothetical protein